MSSRIMFVFLTFVLSVSQYGVARDSPPSCPEPTTGVLVLNTTGKLVLEEENKLIWRTTRPSETVVEAQYDNSGSLVCAALLSGIDAYWPDVVRAIGTKTIALGNPNAKDILFVLGDPMRADVLKEMKEEGQKGELCDADDSVEVLLRRGRALLNLGDAHRESAQTCFELAVKRAPNSVAAHYGTAVVEAALKHTQSAISHYEEVASVRPQFYTARIDLARIFGTIGNNNKEEVLLKNILAENPPLAIQERVLFYLYHFYDSLDRQQDSIDALSRWIAVKKTIRIRCASVGAEKDIVLSSLGGSSADSLIAGASDDLGLRLEEQKSYKEAETYYRDAADAALKSSDDMVGFNSEMGRVRCLRHTGSGNAAQQLCSKWHARLRELGSQLNHAPWRGEELTLARWELSCGDFDKGLDMLHKVAASAASESYDRDPYKVAAPYRAMETIYRAQGEENLAKLAHDTADRLTAASTSQAVAEIVQEAEAIYRKNKAGAASDAK
jgi:tetratricopeptide (TPR) repeat protein